MLLQPVAAARQRASAASMQPVAEKTLLCSGLSIVLGAGRIWHGIGAGTEEGRAACGRAAKGGGGYQCETGAARRIDPVAWIQPRPSRTLGVPPPARWESLADPLKPYDPASLRNPPIFPD